MLPPRWRELDHSGSDGGEAAAAEASAGSADEDGVQDEEEEDDDGEDEGGFYNGSTASLLFYGVRGQQTREGDAPSFFNPLEVLQQPRCMRAWAFRPRTSRLPACWRCYVESVALLAVRTTLLVSSF